MTIDPRFVAPADAYDRFLGRYSRALAPAFIDATGLPSSTQLVLDVGCGPGALAVALAERLGGAGVAAIDPAAQFAAACEARVPDADVRVGEAEALPWDAATFDAALACLVVPFMHDPFAGVREMARVTRPGGFVAACMMKIPGGMEMIRDVWGAIHDVRPDIAGDEVLFGSQPGEIAGLLRDAGLVDVTEYEAACTVAYEGFDDWWEPLTLGIGRVGQVIGQLTGDERAEVRDACRRRLPSGPFSQRAAAWCARGVVA